jgi:hypothetical protein
MVAASDGNVTRSRLFGDDWSLWHLAGSYCLKNLCSGNDLCRIFRNEADWHRRAFKEAVHANNGPYTRLCSTKLHHYIDTIYIDKRYMCCLKRCRGTEEKRREILVSTRVAAPLARWTFSLNIQRFHWKICRQVFVYMLERRATSLSMSKCGCYRCYERSWEAPPCDAAPVHENGAYRYPRFMRIDEHKQKKVCNEPPRKMTQVWHIITIFFFVFFL